MVSDDCHTQMWPHESPGSPDRESLEAGFRRIDEVLVRLHEWRWESVTGILGTRTLSGGTREIHEKPVKDELAADQVERLRRLRQPVWSPWHG